MTHALFGTGDRKKENPWFSARFRSGDNEDSEWMIHAAGKPIEKVELANP